MKSSGKSIILGTSGQSRIGPTVALASPSTTGGINGLDARSSAFGTVSKSTYCVPAEESKWTGFIKRVSSTYPKTLTGIWILHHLVLLAVLRQPEFTGLPHVEVPFNVRLLDEGYNTDMCKGPIIGLESLALQGLPIDKLVLTRESQKELVDLAGKRALLKLRFSLTSALKTVLMQDVIIGNAMTTTVVGSALIALFMVVGDQIGEVDDTPDKVEEIQCLEFNDKALRTYQPTQIPSVDHFYGAYDLRTLAYETVALCYCEGQADIAPHIILVCKKCGHTACKKCGINPQHLYEPCNRSRRPRVDPLDFEVRVKQALPMRLRFDIIDLKRLKDENAGKHNDIWQSIVKDLGDPSIHDLRFRSVRRSRSWTVSYTSARFRLDLLFDESKTTWFLFLLPDPSTPGNCPKRAILKAPIARMESRFDDFLKGYWQFRVPKPYVFRLRTTGLGTQQPSWEANLGLIEPDQADKKVFPNCVLNLSTRTRIQR